MRRHAVAGTFFLAELAALGNTVAQAHQLRRSENQISLAMRSPLAEVEQGHRTLLRQHEAEWNDFRQSLGPTSFIARWAQATQ